MLHMTDSEWNVVSMCENGGLKVQCRGMVLARLRALMSIGQLRQVYLRVIPLFLSFSRSEAKPQTLAFFST